MRLYYLRITSCRHDVPYRLLTTSPSPSIGELITMFRHLDSWRRPSSWCWCSRHDVVPILPLFLLSTCKLSDKYETHPTINNILGEFASIFISYISIKKNKVVILRIKNRSFIEYMNYTRIFLSFKSNLGGLSFSRC